MNRTLISILLFALPFSAQTQKTLMDDLNVLLMHSTFLIVGPSAKEPNKTVFGTVFIIGVPYKTNPTRANYTLVTASHVLDDISGDVARLLMRTRADDGTYSTFWYDLSIRQNGKSLYIKHSTADVAAMYISMPQNVPLPLLSMDFLADDKRLEDLELHPGDEAYCLGFPLMTTTPGGFPILRTGRIASYPITPSATVRSVIFDIFVYPGNSGGPVYFVYDNRVIKGTTNFARRQGILGLVIQQGNSNIPEFADKPLNLGVIVPAYFIRETIAMLPEPK
jgi:S1-C subfamily serine protease